MNNNFCRVLYVVSLISGFLLSSHVFATEGYDSKKFGPKKPIIMENPINVIFDHRVHTEQIGLDCASCHDDLFAMQRGVTPKTDQTMSALAKGKSCGACHDGETAFASNTRCNSCHFQPKDLKTSDPHPHTATH